MPTVSFFVRSLADAIDMQTTGTAMVCPYPTADGKGGLGFTIFQPITTSYIAFDTWPEVSGGAILLVCTCKEAFFRIGKRMLRQTFGGTVETVEIQADLTRKGARIWHESS